MIKKALIAYGTRYGATASTSLEIARVFQEAGVETKVLNAGKEKIKDLSPFDMVIVGSGMQMGKWTGSAEKFLNKFQKELQNKKVAIFVSSAAQAMLEFEKKQDEIDTNRKTYLDDMAAKYGLSPVSLTMFGGVWDYNKMFFIFRKTLSGFKPRIEEAGFKENPPGVYDTRDWEAIRGWAKSLLV